MKRLSSVWLQSISDSTAQQRQRSHRPGASAICTGCTACSSVAAPLSSATSTWWDRGSESNRRPLTLPLLHWRSTSICAMLSDVYVQAAVRSRPLPGTLSSPPAASCTISPRPSRSAGLTFPAVLLCAMMFSCGVRGCSPPLRTSAAAPPGDAAARRRRAVHAQRRRRLRLHRRHHERGGQLSCRQTTSLSSCASLLSLQSALTLCPPPLSPPLRCAPLRCIL